MSKLPRLSKRLTILSFGLLAAGVIIAPSLVSATASVSNSSSSTLTATQQQHLTNIITRGDQEITRRLGQLDKLNSLIMAATHLTASDKTTLTAEVTSETSGLTALKTKLDAETTVAAAGTDAQSIISDYRVYALVTPKVWLIKTADDQQTVEDKLTTLAGKLQTRLTAEKTAGKDVTSLQTTLTDMTTQITTAQGVSSSIETKVLPLQPTDFDSDHTILSGDAAQLKTAHQDNLTAYNDAKTIVTGIKSF